MNLTVLCVPFGDTDARCLLKLLLFVIDEVRLFCNSALFCKSAVVVAADVIDCTFGLKATACTVLFIVACWCFKLECNAREPVEPIEAEEDVEHDDEEEEVDDDEWEEDEEDDDEEEDDDDEEEDERDFSLVLLLRNIMFVFVLAAGGTPPPPLVLFE